MNLDSVLFAGSTGAVLAWIALSAYVLHVSRRREWARGAARHVLALLEAGERRHAPPEERLGGVRHLLDGLSRQMLLHTAADAETPIEAFEVLAGYLCERWPADVLLTEAAEHRRPRDAWRRIAALRIVVRLEHRAALELVERAIEDPDLDVSGAALSLLGASTDPAAVHILVSALKTGRQPAAHIAAHLQNSPQRPVESLRPLLKEADPVVRSWAARLLRDYPGVEGLECELATLTDDPDPRVRKAAAFALGKVAEEETADVCLKLLADQVPFVRAHAARALGELNRSEHAGAIALLLGDADWWVRAAAKQSLEMMGPEVWTVLVRCLDDRDRFVRNGAAEVFQNLGVLDSLVIMEAASDSPSPSKIDLLRRIAHAGGARLMDSFVERSGPTTGPRIRRLLASMGLEQVGTA